MPPFLRELRSVSPKLESSPCPEPSAGGTAHLTRASLVPTELYRSEHTDLIPHSQQRPGFSLEFITTSAYAGPAVSQGEANKQKNHLEGNHRTLGRPKGRIMNPGSAWATEEDPHLNIHNYLEGPVPCLFKQKFLGIEH